MKKFSEEIQQIMVARFGHDTEIALATVEDQLPSVRTVNAYYEDGAFYIITHALSNKMKQISSNPKVAVCGEWFAAHGIGENMGSILAEKNKKITKKLFIVFSEWIENGHTNLKDVNTVILRIDLTDGILYANGTKYEISTER